MGQDISCPCHNNDSNVYFPPEEETQGPDQASVDHIKLPNSPTTVTALNTGSTTHSSNPFDEVGSGRGATVQTPIAKGKSRKWDAVAKDGNGGGDNSSRSTQQEPGEKAVGDSDSLDSRDDAKGEIAFPEPSPGTPARPAALGEKEVKKKQNRDGSAARTPEPSPVQNEAAVAARLKQEAHNDRIVATFNSVMMADGLKVLKHHRRSSKKAASRVIRYVPDYGGALVWDKPLRQPGAKASRVPLDAINQVELEQRIVWISAGDERVGFETSKTEDADLMYQAICILVDRCHA